MPRVTLCSCGTDNPPDSKYCNVCGKHLPHKQPEPTTPTVETPNRPFVRSTNWLFWATAGFVLLFVFSMGAAAGSSETAAVEPTPSPTVRSAIQPTYTPVPTAKPIPTPTTVMATPVPTSIPIPTAVPTATPTTYGLGLALADFENRYGGLTFVYSQLQDGRDRWLAEGEGVIVEVTGPQQSLEEAYIILAADNPVFLQLMVEGFIELVAPSWTGGVEWVGENGLAAMDNKLTTRHGSYTFTLSVTMGLLSLGVSTN